MRYIVRGSESFDLDGYEAYLAGVRSTLAQRVHGDGLLDDTRNRAAGQPSGLVRTGRSG